MSLEADVVEVEGSGLAWQSTGLAKVVVVVSAGVGVLRLSWTTTDSEWIAGSEVEGAVAEAASGVVVVVAVSVIDIDWAASSICLRCISAAFHHFCASSFLAVNINVANSCLAAFRAADDPT